jgi:hypothetical protein
MYTPEYQGTLVVLSLITQVSVHDSTITVRVFLLVSGNQEVPVRRLFPSILHVFLTETDEIPADVPVRY